MLTVVLPIVGGAYLPALLMALAMSTALVTGMLKIISSFKHITRGLSGPETCGTGLNLTCSLKQSDSHH